MVRYSVADSFKKDHPDYGFFNVFEEPYFSERMAMFRGITLRSFAAQSDKNFVLLVYHSDKMPADKRALFAALEKEFPFVRNVFVPGGNMPIPEDLRGGRIITFRIDNDDGLPLDFIERLAAIPYDNVAVSITKIRRVQRVAQDKFITSESLYFSNSMGLAYSSTDGRSVMDLGNHTLIVNHTKVLSIPGTGGLQVIHGTNVSNAFHQSRGKDTEIIIMNSAGLAQLLASEGYAKMDLGAMPISSFSVSVGAEYGTGVQPDRRPAVGCPYQR